MNAVVNTQSYTDIFLRRTAHAIFWSFILQAVFLITFLFVMNFNLWHPVLWIKQSVAVCASFGTWFYICILGLVICAQGMVCCKEFVMVNKYCGSRFSVLCNIFSLRNLIICVLYITIGGFITWIYLSLLGGDYGQLVTECAVDSNRSCLVEEHLFLILNGFWIGIYFFLCDYVFGSKALLFPVVQQLKFLQVKGELQPLMKQAVFDAIMPTVYFVVIYYWRGGTFQYYVRNVLSCVVKDQSLETIFGLLNLSLLFYAWFFSSIFIFTMYTMKLLFQVHLAEHIAFPVINVYERSDCPTLHQTLTITDCPIFQHLGFLDLKILAEKDRARRVEIFTLSQPGGHPYNWNAIVEDSLKLINAFTEDLNKANIDSQPVVESREQVVTRNSNPVLTSPVACPPNVSLSTSTMRNMSMRVHDESGNVIFFRSQHSNQSMQPNVEFQPTPIQISHESVIKVMKSHFVHSLDALCKKPGISFIFGELPEAKVRYYLAQGQPVVWAVQGLSRLAAASFKEDSYGVVQKDLPVIILALLRLKQTLDKLQRVGNYKKSQKVEHHDIKMKAALRSAVKRSLYCICITFGDYLKELQLKNDVLHQLQNFLSFREG